VVVVVVVAVLRLLVPVAGFRAGVLRDEPIRAGGGELDQVPDARVRVRVRVGVSRRKRGVNAPSNTCRTRALARERIVDAKASSTRKRLREKVFRPSRLTALTTTSRGPSEARGNLEASDVLSV